VTRPAGAHHMLAASDDDAVDARCRDPIARADQRYCTYLLRTLARCRMRIGRLTLRCSRAGATACSTSLAQIRDGRCGALRCASGWRPSLGCGAQDFGQASHCHLCRHGTMRQQGWGTTLRVLHESCCGAHRIVRHAWPHAQQLSGSRPKRRPSLSMTVALDSLDQLPSSCRPAAVTGAPSQ
jgi:hypothetical protein